MFEQCLRIAHVQKGKEKKKKKKKKKHFQIDFSSMISVLSGPNLTLELSTFDLLEKNKFFSRRPSASSKKTIFFSRRPSVKVPKLEMTQRELISYYLRLDSERDLISAAT